jgi:polysaccharide biosynthesis/export protein
MRMSAFVTSAFAALVLSAGTALAQDNPPPNAPPPEPPPAAKPGEKEKDEKAAPQQPAADPTKRDVAAYRLRVEDEVQIVVSNGADIKTVLERKVTIPANGDVSLPAIGKIHLLDKTTDEVETMVAQRLKEGEYLPAARVAAIVTRFAPRRVYLMGALHQVLDLPVHKNLRILEVIAQAGGLGVQGADFSHVKIRRVGSGGRVVPFEVNVDDILERGDEQQNVVVFENDIIVVPRLEFANPQSAEWVYVLGKVHQPGRQPIIKSKNPFTLSKLIAMCGDFQEFADRSKIRIVRTTATGREVRLFDFDDILENKAPDVELRPDDLIYVPETWI